MFLYITSSQFDLHFQIHLQCCVTYTVLVRGKAHQFKSIPSSSNGEEANKYIVTANRQDIFPDPHPKKL